MADLDKLAQKLVKEGPFKQETTPRLIRGLFGGEYIFNTTKGVYVWEHPYYPYFYIPISDFTKGVLQDAKDTSEKDYQLAKITTGSKSTDRVIHFQNSELKDLVRIEHSTIDWFVEDEQLLGPHPKDPYKRIECLPSSRSVSIKVSGQEIAHSTQNIFLYETMLRPRYYLAATAVKWEFLKESQTTSYCPYKGMANYYHVEVDGKRTEDVVWYYKYPTAESALIAGRLCFYNEKVDVFLEGEKEAQ